MVEGAVVEPAVGEKSRASVSPRKTQLQGVVSCVPCSEAEGYAYTLDVAGMVYNNTDLERYSTVQQEVCVSSYLNVLHGVSKYVCTFIMKSFNC